jgi:hypothetical protein
MPLQPPKYSREQKDAITALIVDGGKTAPQAVAWAAEHGIGALPPFEMAVGTARDLATKERRRRRGADLKTRRGTPEQRFALLVEQGLAIIEHHYDRMHRKTRRHNGGGELDPADLDRAKRLTVWARELRGLERGIAPTSSGRAAQRAGIEHPTGAAAEAEQQASGLVAEMQADLEARSRSPHTNGTVDGNGTGTTATPAREQEHAPAQEQPPPDPQAQEPESGAHGGARGSGVSG